MKKNKFLSGLSAKLALAIVALTTAMFTSCEKENIEIDVTPVNATAYVNIIVVADNNDVTGTATISASEGTVISTNNSYQIKLVGNPTLASKTIKIDASYNGMNGSVNVTTNELKAGETMSATAKIFLAYSSENVEVKKDENVEVDVVEVENPTPEADPNDWTNNTANKITKPFTYQDIEGSKVLSDDYEGYDETIKALINQYEKDYTVKSATMDVEIPAYSMAVPEVKTTKSIITYNIVTKSRAANDVIVTFTVEDYTTTAKATPVEIGHGHDHGHGSNNNAGGGISNAD